VSASLLAKELGVSRQVIVGDIALLRAAGENITSTPRGYIIKKGGETGIEKVLACRHTPEQTKEELSTIVYYGGNVIDVIVAHPIYGQISAPLNLQSHYDVEQFMGRINSNKAALLSDLTQGLHLHTIRFPDIETYERVLAALDQLGMIYHGED
jgi:transcriptional regulator of NAD metabolism